MFKYFSCVCLWAIILTNSGCITLYKPNSLHSPLLKEKGELATEAAVGISGNGLYNFQTAYAVSNHVGVLANGMYHQRKTDNQSGGYEKLNIFFAEGGVGYFSKIAENEEGLFQCFGGGGYGTSSSRISGEASTPEVSAEFFNVFVQPGLAYIDEGYELAFDVRANYVRLFNIQAFLYDKFEWWNTDYIYTSGASLDFVNLEPAVTLKAGGERLKGILQIGAVIPTVNAKDYFHVNTSSMLLAPLMKFSVGINYSINMIKRNP